MATPLSNRTLVIAIAALVAAAVLGYWGYGVHKKRELRGGIQSTLTTAGSQLREALTLESEPAPADRLKVAQQFDALAEATDKSLEQLKRLQVERDLAAADRADGHLVMLREIFRRGGASHRLHALHTESLAALQEHMRGDNRTAEWVRQAVRAKERAEKDYRDYRLAVDIYAKLLDELPAAQKRIAPHGGTDALASDTLIATARTQAMATAERAAAEMEKMRRLAGPR